MNDVIGLLQELGAGVLVPGIASIIAGAASYLFEKAYRKRVREQRLARQKEIQEIRLELGDRIGELTEHEASFVPLLVSTSTAQAPSGVTDHAGIERLRDQIRQLEAEVRGKQNEIVEISRIDPVLEATIKASLENLTRRVESLEKNMLSKYDVVVVVLQILSGLGALLGMTFGIIKYLIP